MDIYGKGTVGETRCVTNAIERLNRPNTVRSKLLSDSELTKTAPSSRRTGDRQEGMK